MTPVIRLLACFIVGCFSVFAHAATYYVDQGHASASNTNPGTESAPWKTIQHAANVLQAGDIVYVKQGTYKELTMSGPETDINALKPQNSGTAGNYITYQAYPGHAVIIDQNNEGLGFFISARHYIKIKGFIIRNIWGATDKGAGVMTTANASNVIVEDNHIYNLDGIPGSNIAGIRFDSVVKAEARNNLIHDVLVGGEDNGNASGITSYAMEDVIIENNTLYNAHNGLYHKMSSGGIGALVRKNIIYNTSRGLYYDVAGGGSPPHINQRITQNIIYNTFDAIRLDASDSAGVNDGFHVWNNTIIAGNGSGIWFENAKNVNIYNNIVTGPIGKKSIRSGPSSVTINEINYNNYYNAEEFVLNLWASNEKSYNSLAAWQSNEGYDQNGTAVDPQFVDATTRNYKLDANSPLRGAGKNGVTVGAYINDSDVIGYVAVKPKSPTNTAVQ